MNILVVGAGATGGYYGMRLAQGERDVSFLVRPDRMQALRERGLRLTGVAGEGQIQPRLLTVQELDGPFDLVILSVKATALDSAIEDFAAAVGEKTRILPLLNGIRHLDILGDRFGRDAVLCGVIKIATQLNEDGDIVMLAPGATMELGTQQGVVTPEISAISSELTVPGFELSISPDPLAAMWHKWVFIATIGGLTCMMRGTVGDIVACPTGVELGPRILAEAAAISAAAGHPVPNAQFESTRNAITQAGSPLASSLYRDMSHGAGTEVEHVLGDLVSRARAFDVATPKLDLATLHLRVYERRRAHAAAL
jgi:2-dehydropantoate 2-reductase